MFHENLAVKLGNNSGKNRNGSESIQEVGGVGTYFGLCFQIMKKMFYKTNVILELKYPKSVNILSD